MEDDKKVVEIFSSVEFVKAEEIDEDILEEVIEEEEEEEEELLEDEGKEGEDEDNNNGEKVEPAFGVRI